ncbi:MAG: SAM-dependent methyltransferase [Hydrogenophilales bacterium]|nr:SAM-dependent methyltransferase [Hydrogenophilales bacterium]
MGLMFSRLAHNFIKNGYFPTDESTLGRILNALDIDGGQVRIIDPCCGEGIALAEVKNTLTEAGASVEALGIEFDAERAWHAKQLLDTVLHCDMNDAWVSTRLAGLLFLNPPYGFTVADTGMTGDGKNSERLEMIFLRKTVAWLQVGGVLVFIVPHYVMSEEMANFLGRHFSHLTAWSAPERQFKQMVIFGIRRRPTPPSKGLVESLMKMKETLPPELPEAWPHAPLLVPERIAGDDTVFQAIRLNGPELAVEIARHHASTLWPSFPRTFSAQAQSHRRPLRMLSDWHLALGLAAGQIGGFVDAEDGRTFLIKGATHKEKDVTVQHETDAKGNVSETRILTDKFVPVIRAIDFTAGSPTFGHVLTIR